MTRLGALGTALVRDGRTWQNAVVVGATPISDGTVDGLDIPDYLMERTFSRNSDWDR